MAAGFIGLGEAHNQSCQRRAGLCCNPAAAPAFPPRRSRLTSAVAGTCRSLALGGPAGGQSPPRAVWCRSPARPFCRPVLCHTGCGSNPRRGIDCDCLGAVMRSHQFQGLTRVGGESNPLGALSAKEIFDTERSGATSGFSKFPASQYEPPKQTTIQPDGTLACHPAGGHACGQASQPLSSAPP